MSASADLKRKEMLFRLFVVVTLPILLFMVVALLLLNLSVMVTPSPVIARCSKTGEVSMHRSVAPVRGTTEPALRFFMESFVGAYTLKVRGGSEEQLTLMTTPTFRASMPKEAWRPPAWNEEGMEASFTVDNMKVSGDPATAEKVSIMGTGHLLFRPKLDVNKVERVPAFFKATVLTMMPTERTPFGLLADYYEITMFEDDAMLDKFLSGGEEKK